MTLNFDHQHCLNCTKKLRRYAFWQQPWARERKMVWGYDGRGYFCSLRCGFAFGTNAALALDPAPIHKPIADNR